MKRLYCFLIMAVSCGVAAPAPAAIDVVTTTTDLAWIARRVGGNLVKATSLAPGNQDPHRIEPRASQVTLVGSADVFARIGMDLDTWADALLRSAGNRKVSSGGAGYCDCSAGLRPLEVPQGRVSPAQGDIHIYGNPHYLLDPNNVILAARNLMEALGRVDPGHRDTFHGNYQHLVREIDEATGRWRQKLAPFRGRNLVTYHKTWPYFLQRFGLVELDNVEPKPGIEPSAGHVAGVARLMNQNGVRVILAESYRSRRYSDLLARQSGGVVVSVPVSVGGEKGVDSYFAVMDTIVNRLAEALK